MKKRMRKKMHVGEFQAFGFQVAFGLDPSLSSERRDALLDRFLRDAIEANELQFGGGGAEAAWHGFVTIDEPGDSATEEDRKSVEQWMIQEPGIRRYLIGPLVDAWEEHFEPPSEGWVEK